MCGTDLEIINGDYRWAPPGEARLAIGHESLGEVLQAPDGRDLAEGDLVVGIVRRPDPVPCSNCAVDEWDMCRNASTPSGASRNIMATPGSVLLEPATVLAKAWEHISRIGRRATWQPATVLVTGAGPIGLLAALLGRQLGLEVHVLDQVTEGLKPRLVTDLGATYHHGTIAGTGIEADVVIECMGVGRLVFDAMEHTAANGIVCLTGLSSGSRSLQVDAGP